MVNDGPRYRYTKNQLVIERNARKGERNSLCENILLGLLHVRGDKILICEDDDYYAPGYFSYMVKMLDSYELFGLCENRYYSVGQGRWMQNNNRNHASLCTTGLRSSAIPELWTACELGRKTVDKAIWFSFARTKHVMTKHGLQIGIKNMPGTHGLGLGHKLNMGHADPGLAMFRAWQVPEVYLQYHIATRKLPEIAQVPLPQVDDTIDVTIGVVVRDQAAATRKAIESLLNTTTHLRREILIWDNDSQTAETLELLRAYDSHPDIRVIHAPENLGYVKPMHELSRQSRGAYFVGSNNDIVAHPGWFEAMRRPFGFDSSIAQTGPVPGFGFLDKNLRGVSGKGQPDYIEGYFFMVPRWVLNKFPLYDVSHLDFAYFEDADLSLRLQEAGYKIVTCRDAKIDHIRSLTRNSNAVVQLQVSMAEEFNHAYMLRRWKIWNSSRRFGQQRIVVRRRHAHGDLLSAEPALRGLRAKYPNAYIAVATDSPSILEGCPSIDECIPFDTNYESFSTVVELTDAHEKRLRDLRPAVMCGVANVPYSYPQYWLTAAAIEATSRFDAIDNLVVLHTHATWFTRRWDAERWKELGKLLEQDGYHVVEVGGAGLTTGVGEVCNNQSWAETAAIISRAKVFVGVDSACMHIALGLSIPSVVIFGPTMPEFVSNSPFLHPVQSRGLACLGCYHEPPFPRRGSRCHQPELYCQLDITPDRMLTEIHKVLQD